MFVVTQNKLHAEKGPKCSQICGMEYTVLPTILTHVLSQHSSHPNAFILMKMTNIREQIGVRSRKNHYEIIVQSAHKWT